MSRISAVGERLRYERSTLSHLRTSGGAGRCWIGSAPGTSDLLKPRFAAVPSYHQFFATSLR